METPKTQLEAIRYFSDEETCHAYMVNIRWNGKVTCPHCNSDKVGKFSGKRKVSNCKACKKQFTVKLGTIFEDSALPLTKWLPAFWMIVNAKNGISSCEMARSLGVTQKSAWHMGHRIRLAIRQGSIVKLEGTVEVDESYIGGLAKNRHKKKKTYKGTGMVGKQGVLGLLERSKDCSRVIAHVIPTNSRQELQGSVHAHVEKQSEIHTDAWHCYKGLDKDYTHKVVDHAVEYVTQNVHTNGLENFWSLFKRAVKGTYICPRPFHLFRYLDEQTYRFNDRKLTDGERFLKAISSVEGKKLQYRTLIGQALA